MTALLDDFLVRAALAALGVALSVAPLGCFVVWRRMAYFGDATAHAAVLGVAFAIALALPLTLGAAVVALGMGVGIVTLAKRGTSVDTLLGVLSHGALAFGLVALSLIPGMRGDVMSLLVGDILAVGPGDLAVIWGGGLIVAGLVLWRWSALLTATLSPELAAASGIDTERESLTMTLALGLTVAVALKVVGALLIGALLILPAAAARPISKTPEGMAANAAALGSVSALGGLAAAWVFDTPAGPTIVCAAAVLFALTMGLSALRRV